MKVDIEKSRHWFRQFMYCQHRIFFVMALIIAGTVFSLLFFFNPADVYFFPPCPFHYITGLYCPGCGSLRAVHQLLHGNLRAAFDLNPLMVLMLPFVMLSIGLPFICKRPLAWNFLNINWGWVLFFTVVVFWILRNIPFFPFNVLAP